MKRRSFVGWRWEQWTFNISGYGEQICVTIDKKEHRVWGLKWNFISSLTKVTARVCLFGGFVERLALHWKLLRLAHQVIQLLAAHQNLLDCVAQNDLRLVQVLLHFGERISFSRVLILAYVSGKLSEADCLLGSVRPLIGRDFCWEFIKDFRE